VDSRRAIAEIGRAPAAIGLAGDNARRMRIPTQPEPPIRPRETPPGGPGLARLRIADTPLPDEAIAALLPDFAVERERQARPGTPECRWSDLPRGCCARRRAGALPERT